jgi:hypothetical protein
MLGPWATQIRELQERSNAKSALDINAFESINLEEEAIEDAALRLIDNFAHDMQQKGMSRWFRWAIEALFHPEVRALLSPVFFQFFKIGERVGEGDLRFIDEILHADAFGPKAALVWWAFRIDSWKSLEDDEEFVSEDIRAFTEHVLRETDRLLSATAKKKWMHSPARHSWGALIKVAAYTNPLPRPAFYFGRAGDEVGALALAQTYYNEARRLDKRRKAYAFLQEPF